MDCTFGRGGHARALLERVGERGRVLALDKDPEAVRFGQCGPAADGRLTIMHTSFTHLEEILKGEGLFGAVNGILFDLGVSSPQLDDPRRGFSFQQDGPVDMRMDPGRGVSAAQWIARAKETEIVAVLKTLGEERHARRIARAIVLERKRKPIERTGQLAELVAKACPTRERKKHPATRTFQAIRMHVNEELEDLRVGLEQAVGGLTPGGRLAVISFHSLEDRIVKRFMRSCARPESGAPGVLPGPPVSARPLLKILGRPRRASQGEILANPRARSSLLRVAEKCA